MIGNNFEVGLNTGITLFKSVAERHHPQKDNWQSAFKVGFGLATTDTG